MLLRKCIESKDKRFRYSLKVSWAPNLPHLAIGMLNPSTANKAFDDQTSKKVTYFADRLGFGGFTIFNLFAWKATDPLEMLTEARAGDPARMIGESIKKANRHIINACADADTLVVAWGNYGEFMSRDIEVMRLIEDKVSMPLHCFDINRNGTPKHPLYVPKTAKLKPYSTEQLIHLRFV